MRGRIELAPDNRTEIDERWADENTLEWVLYGDEEEKEAAIEGLSPEELLETLESEYPIT